MADVVIITETHGRRVSYPLASHSRYGVVKLGDEITTDDNGALAYDEVTEEWLQENLT